MVAVTGPFVFGNTSPRCISSPFAKKLARSWREGKNSKADLVLGSNRFIAHL
jgi:hypothetical protein